MIYTVLPAKNIFPGVERFFNELNNIININIIYLNKINKIQKDDTVIFGAYHPQYSLPIRQCKAKKKFITWHSPSLQSDLYGTAEIEYLQIIINFAKKGILDGIIFLDYDNYEVFKDIVNSIYLPHPITTLQKDQIIPPENRNDISLFTVWHHRKNILNSLAATKLVQQKYDYTLYVNGMSPHYKIYADLLDIKYTDCGWMEKDEYEYMISRSKVGIQTFLSDAFSYATASYFINGTPCIISKTIAENFDLPNKLHNTLVCKNIDSPIEISNKILEILQMPDDDYLDLSSRCTKCIMNLSERNNKKINNIFKSYF